MLDKLEKQGWTIEKDENGTVTIFACFDGGYWSYINIWSTEAFKIHFKDEPAFVAKAELSEEKFVVTSITTHRMTNPYDSYYLEGKVNTFDDALSLANDACQYEIERFDAFCKD